MIVRPQSILLDAEALSALAAGERRMQAWATVARRTDSVLYASAATLAETTDGSPRDAEVRRASQEHARQFDVERRMLSEAMQQDLPSITRFVLGEALERLESPNRPLAFVRMLHGQHRIEHLD